MTQKKTRVGIYMRVPTGMQAGADQPLAIQKAEMLKFAEARGWEITAEFVDVGESSTDMDRPGLQSTLEAAEAGVFDVLLVHELSCLSHRLFDTLSLLEQLGELEIGFASVKEPRFDFSTSPDRSFLTTLAVLDQYYVDRLKSDVSQAQRGEQHRRARYTAATLPYGYRRIGDAGAPPEITSEEAEVVKTVFERYATGLSSYQEIADWLNEQGHRTRAGCRFSKDTVADMLHDPFYKGRVVYRQCTGETIKGQHEGIASEDLWDACVRVREQRKAAPRTYQPHYQVHLLNGIVACDVCGRKLRAQGASSGDYYREESRGRGFTDCPVAGHGVRAEEIDRQMGAIVRGLQLPDDWRARLQEMTVENESGETLSNQRARLMAERRRLKRAWIRGDFDEADEDIYDQALQRVRRELALLPAPADLAATKRAADVIEELQSAWDDADKETRRDLLRLALREVSVDVLQGRVTAIEPHPAFIPLFRETTGLREARFGVFHPVWTMEQMEKGEALELMEIISPVEKIPGEPEQAPDWPLVVDLPVSVTGKRITPMLSDWLKMRRRTGEALGPVVTFGEQQVLPLKLDQRYWAEVEVESIGNLKQLADESVAFLWTPFALQRREAKAVFARDVWRALEPGGVWALVDVLPESMAKHWLYRYFPEAWDNDLGITWNAYELYNALRGAGFEVDLKRRSVHQAIHLGTAWEMATKREHCPQLALMPDRVYEMGISILSSSLSSPIDGSPCCQTNTGYISQAAST